MDEDIQEHLTRGRYREGFELVLRRYQTKVFRLAYSILGNQALAEEAAQEAFLRFWKALPLYNSKAALATWLYAIARNACLTELRKRAVRKESALDDAMPHEVSLKPEGIDVDRVLSRLPDPYRRVLILFYLEEKSYQEVSALLGLPMGTVKTHLHRARELAAKIAAEQDTRGKSYGLRRV